MNENLRAASRPLLLQRRLDKTKPQPDRSTRNNAGSTTLDTVAGPFDDVKPLFDLIQGVFGTYGLELDYEFIKETRPKIAENLRAE